MQGDIATGGSRNKEGKGMADRKLKVGLIGLGNMGSSHARDLTDMCNVDLVGVCDIVKELADKFADSCKTKAYYNYKDLFAKSGLEAVVIAVPHFDHTPIAIEAMELGIHVMCEKPVSVHVNDAKKMDAAYAVAKKKYPDLVYGLMFMERTYPNFLKIKDILDSGELGQLVRATWINTAWFRSQTYYNSGGWRATWAGEGGGILTNQCPHNLDMYQWLFGLPEKVSGFAHLGKYHDIEVEDEVTGYFEHANGMVGHFIVSTGETPGTNRLEIVGENGRLIYENGKITLNRNRMSMFRFIRESKEAFGNVESWYTEVPSQPNIPGPHRLVLERFAEAVLHHGTLIAEGREGLNSVMLANAIMLSSHKGQSVALPLDGDEYEAILKERAKTSRFH
jgi:predicted dehydrogenase